MPKQTNGGESTPRPRAASWRVGASALLGLVLSTLGACSSARLDDSAAPSAIDFDLVIAGGEVYGIGSGASASGASPLRVDVGIRDGRIVELGDLGRRSALRRLDAAGLVVAPGFIDTHSHVVGALSSPDRSSAEALLRQGITTVVVGPDGWGAADLAAERDRLLEHGLGVNVAQMVGHSTVRRAVLGEDDRRPSREELEEMRALVRAAFEEGAVGLSSGPFYAPGSYADTDELVALAEVAAEYGGVYQSHIRDESNYSIGLLAAVDEVIEVAQRARLPGIVTHVKALGPPVWGKAAEVVERIEAARARGVSVWADQYPYLASATGLSAALIPRWAQAGGYEALLERLEETEVRDRILGEMGANLGRRGGPERIQLRYFAPDPSLAGQRLSAIAERRRLDPVETALALILEADGDVGIVSFNMRRDDFETFARQPWVLTASDGSYPPWGRGVPHPRGFGTFPRVVAELVERDGLLSLEEAIDRASRGPARLFGLADRGVIAEGAHADIVVFDRARFRDLATFTQPYQLAEGVRWVVVNGVVALDDRQVVRKAGVVLRSEIAQR